MYTIDETLATRANDNDEDAADFHARYVAMKNYLEMNYYRWVQAECSYFTDHGELHIRSVIQSTSHLLSEELGSDQSSLTSLDLFLLLSSILWHDVGMVLGRSGHAQRIVEMSQEIRALGFPNLDIHRLVTEISVAHGGKQGLMKPKDREDCSTGRKTYVVYPKSLASVLRFADEISENQSRVSQAIKPNVPPQNKIFWEYASCVSASLAEPKRNRVRLNINIPMASAAVDFECAEFQEKLSKTRVPLIEYAICRIEKMNNERVYCSPYLGRYANIKEIEVSLSMTSCSNERIPEFEDNFIVGDGGLKPNGYPTVELFSSFFAEHPQWSPQEIARAVVS